MANGKVAKESVVSGKIESSAFSDTSYLKYYKDGHIVIVTGWFAISEKAANVELFQLPFTPITWGCAMISEPSGSVLRFGYWDHSKSFKTRESSFPAHWYFTNFSYATNE